MAKKESKVSINCVDKYLKSRDTEPVAATIGDNDAALDFTVKRYLNWDEMTAMVYNAANGVFFDDDGEEVYHPEFEEIAMASAMLTFVGNFKAEMSMGRVHELMYCGVLSTIKELWCNEQYSDFVDQFRRMVDHKVAMIMAGERSKLMKISDKLDQASEAMKIVTDAFGGISAEQMQAVIDTMSSMDAFGLANAVIDARDKDFVERRRTELSVIK
jgi:hypothetical protein